MLTESYAKGPATPPVRELTIGDALREVAEECPAQIALIAGTPDTAERRTWTYAELLDEAQLTARALLEIFEPGDRVAVWAPNIPEWVIMEYGCALAGIVLVTVNPSYQADELAYVLRQSRAAGIFLLPDFRGNPMLHHLESVQDDCPELKSVILFSQWQDFLASAGDKPLPTVLPNDACMIQYTSGTTGFPKGALLHHRGLVNNGSHTLSIMGAESGQTYMGIMPLFHTAGCVLAVLGALSKRSALVLVEVFEPGLVLELMEEYRAAAMLGVPTMLIAMIEHPTFVERDLSAVRALCSGGSTVPADLVKRLEEAVGAPFTIVFGQTECSPVACMTHADDSLDDKAHTLGQAMPGVEVKIVDTETGDTQPVGVLGEFCTRGYHVMHEYFENPEATAKTIDADGWLHTGDLCSMDARGYCKIEGRLKDMIIRGGENIYPREIEELLFQHPSVGEVAVVGLPNERLGEEVAVFLRPAPGSSIDKDLLFTYLREHLSPQKTPRHWFEVEAYPLTGSGKIQKFALREGWENGQYTEMS
ncbi:AMP-binding protein [Congregibacter variabilis]|uniref:AMP-binding protein n=1 Tax=Congregibacter variabilis TaxID=3081200 RepID=A0ABZ0I5Y3_9GAMM|nr:AMP-binding protein [Congregibacter sp. IMCC43200]